MNISRVAPGAACDELNSCDQTQNSVEKPWLEKNVWRLVYGIWIHIYW
jgi:hypothetical protein